MQISDILVFWGFSSLPYFVKWYPPFTVVLLFVIWLNSFIGRWNERDRDVATAQLAQSIAHDIRPPIAALNVLLSTNGSLSTQNSREMLTGILNSIQAMTNRLILRSNPQKTPLRNEVPLNEVVRSAAFVERLRRNAANPSAVEIVISTDSSEVWVLGDRHEIERALLNIIGNAVEATLAAPEKGGTRTPVRISVSRNHIFAFVSVRDTGIGIPPEKINAVAKRGATFGKSTGSGIGLWSAKTAIESISGSVSISSTPYPELDHGTEVILSIPLSHSHPSRSGSHSAP